MANPIKFLASRVMAPDIAAIQESSRAAEMSMEYLEEKVDELERNVDSIGWIKLGDYSDLNLSREKLNEIAKKAFVYFLKNPLIKSAVRTQTMYVFGQGVTIQAEHPLVNQVIQDFIDDPKNKAELTCQQAMTEKENELQIFANLFFVFFVNEKTGKVRIRTLPFAEVMDIIYNPEDSKDPWYYKRVWTGATGAKKSHIWYYPDWRYEPKSGDAKPNDGNIRKEKVYQVAVNRIGGMKFGVSEVYAALDWAKAYKEFLENWATIVRSYARFTWNMTTGGGAKGVQAIKNKLKSVTMDVKGSRQRVTDSADNVTRYTGPQAANIAIGTEGTKLEPIKTAGATTSADDGRRLLLMVSSATGIFEHYLSGDPSTGNLATAKSMERPMELMFVDRQALWFDIFYGILQYVIDKAAMATTGDLNGTTTKNDWGETIVILEDDTENEDPEKAGEPISRQIDINFPDILEKDVVARVGAVVSAITLNGQAMAGTIPDVKEATAMLLNALGTDNVDEVVKGLFPGDEPVAIPEKPAPAPFGAPAGVPDTFTKAAASMEAIRNVVEYIVKKYDKV